MAVTVDIISETADKRQVTIGGLVALIGKSSRHPTNRLLQEFEGGLSFADAILEPFDFSAYTVLVNYGFSF